MILGGGKRQFGLNATNDNSCKRKDGKNLVEDWKKYKKNFKYISTNEELKLLNVDQTDYLLGKPNYNIYFEDMFRGSQSFKP